uniref:Uncharacterized protein n=1 Tax=Anguilla anguilla TaxID=7936 RepID=A0A0E9U9C6_ANGAN
MTPLSCMISAIHVRWNFKGFSINM